MDAATISDRLHLDSLTALAREKGVELRATRRRRRRLRAVARAVSAPWPAGSPRRRWGRWIAALGGFIGLVAVLVVFLTYRRQIVSYLTHWKGGPDQTWPYVHHGEQPLVHLAAVGDTGDSGSHVDAAGAAIATIGREEPFDALLLLGDMVYPSGDPALLDDRVFQPFDAVLDTGTDLLAILGNHDVGLDRGDEIMERLGMPGRWWQRTIGDVTIIGLDSTRIDDPAQRVFLEGALETADTMWTIVALHHPPYSAGYQGSSLASREAFAPLFERFGVQLVLSGHDHDYQRSEVINGVTYVVSGAGSGRRLTGEDDFTAVSYAFVHFLDLAVYDDRIVGRAVGVDGEVADEFQLVPATG